MTRAPSSRSRGAARRAAAPLAAVLLGAGALAPSAAHAQVALRGAGLVSQVEHRVAAARGVEVSSGLLYGGLGRLEVGAVHVEFRALSGDLTPDSVTAEDRTLRAGALRVAILAVPWLAMEVGASARRYETALASQRWIASHLGAALRLEFVGGALHGIVRGEIMPTVAVSGLDRPTGAFAAGAGLAWRSGILTAGVHYSLERYTFPAAAAGRRREQVAALTANLGLAIGGTRR